MNIYMFIYERVGTQYYNQKLLIIAENEKVALEKANIYIEKLSIESNYKYKYKINKNIGMIDIIDIQKGFEDSIHINGFNSKDKIAKND